MHIVSGGRGASFFPLFPIKDRKTDVVLRVMMRNTGWWWEWPVLSTQVPREHESLFYRARVFVTWRLSEMKELNVLDKRGAYSHLCIAYSLSIIKLFINWHIIIFDTYLYIRDCLTLPLSGYCCSKWMHYDSKEIKTKTIPCSCVMLWGGHVV